MLHFWRYPRCLALFAAVVTTTKSVSGRDSHQSEVHQTVETETQLYNLIKAKEWNLAMDRLRAHPSEANVLIEQRGAHGGVILRHYPLHEALVAGISTNHQNELIHRQNMTIDQVELLSELIAINPDAVAFTDANKRMPLHLALYSAILPPRAVVQELVDGFPSALPARDSERRLPLHAAAYYPMTSYETLSSYLMLDQVQPFLRTKMMRIQFTYLHGAEISLTLFLY